MSENFDPQPPVRNPEERAAETRVHPALFRIILGLAVVLVLGIFGFAGGGQQYNNLVLTIAALFVVVAFGIPTTLWLIWQRWHREGARSDPFGAWLGREVEIWQGHLKGGDAAAAILLPIIAVSVGMVVFAIELNVVAH